MNQPNPIFVIGFIFLIINTLIGFIVQMQIKQILKSLYPDILNRQRTNSSNSSMNTSLDFISIIINPPAEIIDPALLRLFTAWKIIVSIQLLLLLGMPILGVLLGEHSSK